MCQKKKLSWHKDKKKKTNKKTQNTTRQEKEKKNCKLNQNPDNSCGFNRGRAPWSHNLQYSSVLLP